MGRRRRLSRLAGGFGNESIGGSNRPIGFESRRPARTVRILEAIGRSPPGLYDQRSRRERPGAPPDRGGRVGSVQRFSKRNTFHRRGAKGRKSAERDLEIGPRNVSTRDGPVRKARDRGSRRRKLPHLIKPKSAPDAARIILGVVGANRQPIPLLLRPDENRGGIAVDPPLRDVAVGVQRLVKTRTRRLALRSMDCEIHVGALILEGAAVSSSTTPPRTHELHSKRTEPTTDMESS